MFSLKINRDEKAMSILPRAVEELISEYEGNGTFRVPKDVTTLRLCFEIDNSTMQKPNTHKCIEIPVGAGLWMVERTSYIYGSRTLFTLVFRRKEDVLPSTAAKVNTKGLFDQILSMTACVDGKALLKVSMEHYELYAPVKISEKSIALPFRRLSTKEFGAYDIMNTLILQKAVDHNKGIPLRIKNDIPMNIKKGALVLTGITPKNRKKYIPKLKLEHIDELLDFKEYDAELNLMPLGNAEEIYHLVVNEVGAGGVLVDIERKHLAPLLKDLLSITDLTAELDAEQHEDEKFIRIFDHALQDEGIRQAFQSIMTTLESKKEEDKTTYKDFFSLLPLLSYDNLIRLGQWVNGRYDRKEDYNNNEDDDNNNEEDDNHSEDDDNDDEDDDNHSEDEKKVSGPIFAGLVFAVSGKMSKPQGEIKDLIAENGGELKSSVTKAVTHVLANEIGSGKTQKALNEGKKIVTEQWLFDTIKAGRLLSGGKYFLS